MSHHEQALDRHLTFNPNDTSFGSSISLMLQMRKMGPGSKFPRVMWTPGPLLLTIMLLYLTESPKRPSGSLDLYTVDLGIFCQIISTAKILLQVSGFYLRKYIYMEILIYSSPHSFCILCIYFCSLVAKIVFIFET